jgi:DNA-directed RNA polymerase specialized sigma24 family protein
MIAAADPGAANLEAHRHALIRLAYRMLARGAAEDVVQDLYPVPALRLPRAIAEPLRYLGTVVMRLCIDRPFRGRPRFPASPERHGGPQPGPRRRGLPHSQS